MKILVNIVRVIVGVLFIFSGLIKANDPLSLSYKMQEFFELWGMMQFNDHTLWLSIVMIAFEIIAGVALLLGWRMKLFIWLLLLLIIFFTFLTGYAYLSGKFKNCGCFGDCIPITPVISFTKDIVLTILIVFLFIHREKIKPVFSKRVNGVLMLMAVLLSFAVQWYTLTYQPVFDCLPYKKGNNITVQMKPPVGSVPDSFAIRFIYKKDGKQFEFAPAELPADLAAYEFVSRADKLIRKGNAEPPIKGFSLSGISNEDSTEVVLSQPYALLVFAEDFSVPVAKWKKEFETVYAIAKAKNIPAYMITNRKLEAAKQFAGTTFTDMPVFSIDYTAIRTAARTNPCFYILKEGTILEKESYPRISKIKSSLEAIPVQQILIPVQDTSIYQP